MKTKYIISIFVCVILSTNIKGYAQNILSNGDFSNATDIISFFDSRPPENIWSSFQDSDVIAKATVVNGICNYEITRSGNNTYSVQLTQGGFSLKPGHSYKLSVDVKADSNRTFSVFLGENGGNWTNFIDANNYKQNATIEWRNISVQFDVFTVFPYHKLSFELGTINTSILFDNVMLIDLGVKKQAVSSELNSLNKNISNPGFKPESDFSQAFINSYKESKFIIYPTITRAIDTTTWSKLLSKEFAQNLKRDENLNIRLNENFLNPGELMGKNQFEFFKNDMEKLGNELKMKKEKIDYCIIPEIIFEPKRNGTLFVFGIHIFILNNKGENVFSFLLNSHHELFVEAKLYAYNPNENDLEELKQRCLSAGIKAFKLMVNKAGNFVKSKISNEAREQSHKDLLEKELPGIENYWNYIPLFLNDGLEWDDVNQREKGTDYRTIQTLNGEEKISVVEGFRVMYKYKNSEHFVKMQVDQSKSDEYENDKSKLINFIYQRLNNEIVVQHLTYNNNEYYYRSANNLKYSPNIGMAIVFYPEEQIIITIYFLNQEAENRSFQTIEEFNILKDNFIKNLIDRKVY